MASYAQSSAAPVSVTAPRGKGDRQRKVGELISFSVDVAENGFVGRCRHEPKKDKRGYPEYTEPAEYVLPDLAAVHAWIDEKVGTKKSDAKK